MRKFIKVLAFAGAAAVASSVQASPTSCASLESGYASYLSSYGPDDPNTLAYLNDLISAGCRGVQGPVGTASLQGSTVNQAQGIFSALAMARNAQRGSSAGLRVGAAGTVTGLSAGGPDQKWNVWGGLGMGANKDMSTRTITESDMTSLLLGADYRVSPAWTLGLSAAIDGSTSQLKTPGVTNDVTIRGYNLAPYFGWQINQAWALDATAGFGEGQMRNVALGSEADSRRYFAGANLTYSHWMGDWELSGKGSYLAATEEFGLTRVAGLGVAGSGSKNKLGQLRLGGQAAYWMGGGVMPYAGLAYVHDATRTVLAGSQWDRNALALTLGVNLVSVKEGVTGGIVFVQEYGRSQVSTYSLNANVNIRF